MRISDWSSDVCSSDLAVLPCALAACARAPAPVVSLNAEPLPPSEQAWRDTIAPADQALLEELPSIWTQVLATARKRSAAKIDAEGPLLEADAALDHPALPPGDRKSTRLNSSH